MKGKGRKALALGMSFLLATVSIGCSGERVADDYQDMPEKIAKAEPPNLLEDTDFLDLVHKLNPTIEPAVLEAIATAIGEYSFKYQVPPSLIIAVIAAESRFHPHLTGALDDTGLMQIRHKYASYWANLMDIPGPQNQRELMDIDTNIHMGTFILRRLLDRYDDNLEKVLVAYNAGETYVDRKIKEASPLPTRYITKVSRYHMELCNAPVLNALE